MARLKIGLDWDDVTARFNSIAIEMANKKYGYANPLRLEDITSWANTGRASVIKEFYGDIELYKRQAEYGVSDSVKKIIHELEKFADVFFITAVHPNFMGIRAEQIKTIFPELPNERIILGAAKSLVKFDIILDDNIDNVLDSPSDYAVLMRKPWNTEMTGVLSVNNMQEFLTLAKHIAFGEKSDDWQEPKIICLVGPSGSNKNKVAQILCQDKKRFAKAISYTTNVNDTTKNLVSDEKFESLNLIEKTIYAGNKYGLDKKQIEESFKNNVNVVIPVDMCGAIGLKHHFPSTIIVYCKRRKADIIQDILLDGRTYNEKKLCLLSLDTERKNANLCDIVIDTNDAREAAETILRQFDK